MNVYRLSCWNKPMHTLESERKELGFYASRERAEAELARLKKSREFGRLWQASTLWVEIINVIE